jgi:hypothetical protein
MFVFYLIAGLCFLIYVMGRAFGVEGHNMLFICGLIACACVWFCMMVVVHWVLFMVFLAFVNTTEQQAYFWSTTIPVAFTVLVVGGFLKAKGFIR